MRIPKIYYFLLAFCSSFLVVSQDFSDEWQGHFSYNNIVDVTQGSEKLYAASENAVFTYDFDTQEIDEISSINGLSGGKISNIHYSEQFGLLIIGYQDGLIEVVSDTSDDVLTVVDILDKETIPPVNKNINHFNEYEGLVYISTDYGISVYDLQNLEFGDTYFIGANGSQEKVRQTTIFGDYIYAASENGIRKALQSSDDLIDFNEWTIIIGASWGYIETVGDRLFVIRSNAWVYEITDDVLTLLIQYTTFVLDFRTIDDLLLITTKDNFYQYDTDFNLITDTPRPADFDSDFTCGTINDGVAYVGTKDFGVLKVSNPDTIEDIYPDGPLLNDIFSIETIGNNLWAVFGGYSITFSFSGANSFTGISHYKDGEWSNISYDTIEAASPAAPRFLSHVTPNPLNPDQVYVSSYFSGLIEVEGDEITEFYNQDNSSITPFAGSLHLALDGTYDSENRLWVLNGRNGDALNKFENGQWTPYNFNSLIDPPTSNLGFSSIAIDNLGTKFIGSYRLGVVGFNEEGGTQLRSIGEGAGEGNLPGNTVNTVAIDRRNQLWIGTNKGLRVLFNTSNFFEAEEVNANEIIILEDGVPKELLFQQFISDIEVDGSNNKWVATISSGLFYFSPDGQETIYHFTKDNSPLPSNNVTDVTIDQENGRVYIGTDNGMVSFNAGGSKPTDGLADAFIYPNPVRPSFNIDDKKVKIKDISDNVNIKITDIEGNLVAEAQSRTNSRFNGYNLEIDGGTAFWNGRNLANNTVASGVYLVMLSDLDTFETKVLKVMVVR